jgi:membrane protein DedA with SNARE-associated domain
MEDFIAHWGYLAIIVGTILEGEAVLVAAGAMAHHGMLSLPWVIVAAFAGGVVGDQIWFLLGHRYGTPWLQARPKMLERARVVHTWLDKYGSAFLIGFRFMYGLRSVTPVLLGATGFSMRRFLLFNVLGASVWSISFGAIGYGLGAGLRALLARHSRAHELLLAGIAVAIIVAGVWFWRVRKREAAGTESVAQTLRSA